jgi:hypothetical protein
MPYEAKIALVIGMIIGIVIIFIFVYIDKRKAKKKSKEQIKESSKKEKMYFGVITIKFYDNNSETFSSTKTFTEDEIYKIKPFSIFKKFYLWWYHRPQSEQYCFKHASGIISFFRKDIKRIAFSIKSR